MHEMLQSQMMEANNEFAKFIRRNYEKWLSEKDNHPMLSFDVFPKVVFPLLDNKEKVVATGVTHRVAWKQGILGLFKKIL